MGSSRFVSNGYGYMSFLASSRRTDEAEEDVRSLPEQKGTNHGPARSSVGGRLGHGVQLMTRCPLIEEWCRKTNMWRGRKLTNDVRRLGINSYCKKLFSLWGRTLAFVSIASHFLNMLLMLLTFKGLASTV